MSKLNIGLAQLNSNDDMNRNLTQILEILNSIENPVDIVFFPENSLFFRINEKDQIQYLNLDSPLLKEIAKASASKKCFVHLTLALKENDIPSNASILITPSQKIVKTYSKIHLFDIQLNQEKATRESDCFRRGERPAIFTLKGFRFGQTICYDIRFSELYRYYGSQKVDAILIPAAFLKKTGAAHWHVLNRARAIENQCYVIASAQMGPHRAKKDTSLVRETFGHSVCVSPWGEVLEDLEQTPAIRFIELSKGQIENVKKQIPMDSHRLPNSADWTAAELNLDAL